MYCVLCGSKNPEYGTFCHKCGKALVRSEADPSTNSGHLGAEEAGHYHALERLLKTDPGKDRCHGCGGESEDLTRHTFAFAKVTAVRRDWSETLVRLGISAVSIAAAPVTGFAGVSWKTPGKKTTFEIIKAELVLCRDQCLPLCQKTSDGTEVRENIYRLHPWAPGARELGYETILTEAQLLELTPIQPKNRRKD